jgi:hypothetical protein
MTSANPPTSTDTNNQKAVEPAAAPSAAPAPLRKAVKKIVRKATKRAAKKVPTSAAKKTAAKAASKAKSSAPTAAKPQEAAKVKKPKLVRDSFTFPKDEYQAIASLKQKALSLQHSAKKSEILRAGLKLLSSLNDKAFLAALHKVPALKTGRPAKS